MKVKLLDCSDRSTVKISVTVSKKTKTIKLFYIYVWHAGVRNCVECYEVSPFSSHIFSTELHAIWLCSRLLYRNAPLYLDVLMPCCSPHVLLMALVFFSRHILLLFIFQTNPFLREAKLLQE